MTSALRLIPILVLGLLPAAGCGSPTPSRFFSLARVSPSGSVPGESAPSLVVSPVALPALLDRAQIVVRTGARELQVSEFHRWAQPLAEDFFRALVDGVQAQAPTVRVQPYPWTGEPGFDHRLSVVVLQMDAILDDGDEGRAGDAVLRAHWALAGADGKIVVERTERFDAAIADSDHATIVGALATCVEALAGSVAGELAR